MQMQSNEPDEILCSSCGRPNLPEAVKCWYCQSPLNKDADAGVGMHEVEDQLVQPESGQPAKKPAAPPEPPEDVPEWLKRIREKEQKEREAEDARDSWQQQALFGNSSPAEAARQPRKKETHHPETAKPQKPTEEEKPAEQPSLKAAPPVKPAVEKPVLVEADDIEKEENADIEELTGSQTDELPDGFVKFNPKSR